MSALHELDSLDDAIESLAQEPFGASIISSYTAVAAESLEEPFRTLLVHHDHMTEVLFAYHGKAVGLNVLRRTQIADTYTRLIILTAHDSEQVIETGIVRINLGLLSAPVRQEIMDAEKPLGSIYRSSLPEVGAQIEERPGSAAVQVVSFTELRATCAMRRFRVVVRPLT